MCSTKEQVWLEEYFRCWNATEAARRAGYKWPNKQGPAKKEKLADLIAKEVEHRAMSANEVLLRLAEQARGDIADALKIDHGLVMVDVEKLKELGLTHLIKKFKHTKQGGTEIEFYDAQAALFHLSKLHGLVGADNVNVNVNITDARERLSSRISGIAARIGETTDDRKPIA